MIPGGKKPVRFQDALFMLVALLAATAGSLAILQARGGAGVFDTHLFRLQKNRPVQEAQLVVFGRRGVLSQKTGTTLTIVMEDPQELDDNIVTVQVTPNTEWYKTTIRGQLPLLPSGHFDHSESIVTTSISESEIRPGAQVYAVSAQNIAHSNTLTAIKVTKIEIQ